MSDLADFDAGLAERLLALGTATLYEASGIDCDLECELRPAWPGATMCGPALTVELGPEDNLGIHLALEQAHPGEVLVVNAHGDRCGFWGEVLAIAAQERGVAGLLIDGGVRDVDRLAALAFPAFSRWIAVRRTIKVTTGGIGVPVVAGGRTIAKGDVIVADVDGVIALPSAVVAEVAAAGEAREAKEQDFFARLRNGESTVDLLGLRS